MTTIDTELRERVRRRYAAAATAGTVGRPNTEAVAEDGCCSSGSCAPESIEVDETLGAALYTAGEQSELLAARRVGPTGFVYGVDMTDEMLGLARANAAKAGATNVEFVKGTIEDISLDDATVDVVISNCVINLSVNKPAVLAEMFRVLVPVGRIGISDVVTEDHLTKTDRAARGSYVGCIAGALSQREYLDGLAAAGFTGAAVTYTHEAAPPMHAAIIRAVKPVATADA